MANWEVVEERTISGKGVLRVSGDDTSNRSYVLFCTVLRKPKQSYLNLSWNPPRSRYGTLCFLREGYIVDTKPIEYEKQCWDGVNDVSGQTLIALKCAYDGILETFRNLATALSGTPGGVGLFVANTEDRIKDYENLRLAWDEVRVICYSSTALSLRLSKLEYDTCDPSKVRDSPPPPPPPPKPLVPPDQPVPNSPPYDEDTRDENNTVPYVGDEPEDPRTGEACTAYVITVAYVNNNGDVQTRSNIMYGKIGTSLRVVNNVDGEFVQLQIQSQGVVGQEACGTFGYRRITGAGSTSARIINPMLVSVVPQ